MDVGGTSDGMTLSGFGSGVAEDDYEGRATSTSLTPFLALLSRDERLGWATSRSRADDTDSLNVNLSECGSCHLSEVSSVSSWLNDTSAVDDDYSSCAPDDETGSEKDDVDDDEDDSGPEIRPLFLLQRCLEEKLLERQQNSEFLYPGISDCATSTTVNELTTLKSDTMDVETSTMKRASRNLCTFKSSESTVNSVPVEDSSVTGTDNVISACSQPMPLKRSGSRCNPDSLICTGAIYDFNASLVDDDIKCSNIELVNGNGSNAVDDGQCKVPIRPPQHMHKLQSNKQGMGSLLSEVLPFLKNTSPAKGVETPLCLPAVSKHNFTDKSEVDGKLANGGFEQNVPAVGTSIDSQQTCIANGSACCKEINHMPLPACTKTAVASDSNLDSVSMTANRSSCQSTSLMDFRPNSPSVKSKHQKTSQNSAMNDKSLTVVPLKNSESKISGESSADNIDAASVVSDEVEKASDPACSLGMPMVEDGLSNSDISDVDEAFSMFAGLKPPDPVPVDTSFGAKSPVAGDSKSTKDLDGNMADAQSVSSL